MEKHHNKFNLITESNKYQVTRCYVKLEIIDNEACFYAQADTGSEMSLISQTYLNSLNIDNLDMVSHYQKLETFGDGFCIIDRAINLWVKVEGTSHPILEKFLVSNTSDSHTATVGQDLLRRYGWDFDFATWKTSCNVLSHHEKSPDVEFCSHMYTNENIDSEPRHFIHRLRQDRNTRFSAPFVKIKTEGTKILYFADLGASTSTMSVKRIAANKWKNKVRSSQIANLYGFTDKVPVLGEISLKMSLQDQSSEYKLEFYHTFLVVDVAIVDCSLCLPFFIRNGLVHSSSMACISAANRIRLNRYHYPRDKYVITVKMREIANIPSYQENIMSHEVCLSHHVHEFDNITELEQAQTQELNHEELDDIQLISGQQLVPEDKTHDHHNISKPGSVNKNRDGYNTSHSGQINQDNFRQTMKLIQETVQDTIFRDNPPDQVSTMKLESVPKHMSTTIPVPTEMDVNDKFEMVQKRLNTGSYHTTTPLPTEYPQENSNPDKITPLPIKDKMTTISQKPVIMNNLQPGDQTQPAEKIPLASTMYENHLQEIIEIPTLSVTDLPTSNSHSCINQSPCHINTNTDSIPPQSNYDVKPKLTLVHKSENEPEINQIIEPIVRSTKLVQNQPDSIVVPTVTKNKLPDKIGYKSANNYPNKYIPKTPHLNKDETSSLEYLLHNQLTNPHIHKTRSNDIINPTTKKLNSDTQWSNQHQLPFSDHENVDYIRDKDQTEDPESLLVHLSKSLVIPANTRKLVRVEIHNSFSKYFGKDALVEPTMPIYNNKVQLIHISRQVVTIKNETIIEVINPNDYSILLPPNTFIGEWFLNPKFREAPHEFSNPKAKELAQKIIAKLKELIDAMPDEEVTERVEHLLEQYPWLNDFDLENNQDDRIKLRVLNMCLINQTAFQQKKTDLGLFVGGDFDIELTDDTPINIKPYRTSLANQAVMEDLIQDYVIIGAVEPSTSKWNAPVILVSKPNSNKMRLCIDYRRHNKIIKDYVQVLRSTDYYFDRIREANYFSVLDISNAYFNISIAPEHRKYTSFTIGLKKYQCTRFSFGLSLSGNYWLAIMNLVLGDVYKDNLVHYVDDILVFSKDIEENLRVCDEILRRLSRSGLMVKPSKTKFLMKELKFLGFYHSASGRRNDPEKIAPLFRMAPPHDKRSARKFMGFVNYFREATPALSVVAGPIHDVMGAKSYFNWNTRQVKAFNKVLSRVATSPILTRFETNRECFIFTDASSTGGAAWLMQNDSNKDPHLIATYSRKWNKSERKAKIAHLEALIVTLAVEEWDKYLVASPLVKIFSDNSCLTQILTMKKPSSQQMRWIEQFSKYKIKFCHISSARNVLADYVSRAFKITDPVTHGANYKTINYPWVPLSELAIQTWKDNSIKNLKLREKQRVRDEWILSLKQQHDSEYCNTIEYILLSPENTLLNKDGLETVQMNHLRSEPIPQEIDQTFISRQPNITTEAMYNFISTEIDNTSLMSVKDIYSDRLDKDEDIILNKTENLLVGPHSRDAPREDERNSTNNQSSLSNNSNINTSTTPQPQNQPAPHIHKVENLTHSVSEGHYVTTFKGSHNDIAFMKSAKLNNTLYSQVSEVLFGDNSHAGAIKSTALNFLDTHRDLFLEEQDDPMSIINDIKNSKGHHEIEVNVMSTLLLVPIMVVHKNTATITFPYTYSSKSDIGPFGLIIELNLTTEKGFQWTNPSLVRTYEDPDLQKITVGPDEVYTISSEDLQQVDSNITTFESLKDNITNKDLFQQAVDTQVDPISECLYRITTRSEDTHVLSEPIDYKTKRAARPRVGTVEIPHREFPEICANDVIKAQDTDPFCIVLKAIILQKEVPYKIPPKEFKTYTRLANDVEISQQGILINRSKPDEFGDVQIRVVCPMSFILYVFHLTHNANFHFGIQKTVQYLTNRFWRPAAFHSPSMREMLHEYLNSCVLCPKKKSLRLSHRFKLNIPPVPSGPHQMYSTDYLGPITEVPETSVIDNIPQPTGRTFKYILVTVDIYSGFVFLHATPNATSGYAIKCIEDIVGKLGVFNSLRSDNGSHFCSRFFILSCTQMGIKLTHILPSSAWGNKSERMNLVISDALRVADTSNSPWADYLPWIQICINASYNRSIRTSPFLVQFGRNPRLPIDLITPNPVIPPNYTGKPILPSDHARQLQMKLVKINKIISPRIITEKYTSHMMSDKKTPDQREILPGDICMIKLKLQPNVSKKLYSEWLGYYLVLEVIGSKVVLQTLGGRQTYCQHVNLTLRVDPNFDQKFNLWNEAMLKYADELKLIEVETPDYLDFKSHPGLKAILDNPKEKSKRRIGSRSNIYPPEDELDYKAKLTFSVPHIKQKSELHPMEIITEEMN